MNKKSKVPDNNKISSALTQALKGGIVIQVEGRLAQLAGAPALHAGGHWFKSSIAQSGKQQAYGIVSSAPILNKGFLFNCRFQRFLQFRDVLSWVINLAFSPAGPKAEKPPRLPLL